mgnify:CR=1 FL=1
MQRTPAVQQPLPSRYQTSASNYSNTSRRRTSGGVGRTKTWSKDVVCIPREDDALIDMTTFAIPRGESRGRLAMKGLVGKMRIVSTWSARQVRDYIRCYTENRSQHVQHNLFTITCHHAA